MLERALLAYGIVRRTFGARFRPLVVAMLFTVLRTVIAIGMGLDHVLFPALRRTRIERPIIIVGNPRTGTTFLQRFLAEHGIGTGTQLWGSLYPSILIRKLIRPLLPALEAVSPAKHHSSAAHETSLTSVETDDVAVLFRYFDGFFLYGFILAWDEQDHLGRVDPDLNDTSERDFAWLEKVWRRNLVFEGGDRVLAKLFSTGPRTPQFLERFPDATIVYTVRDPVDVIPSAMSLVTGVLDSAFGFWDKPDALRARFLERLYLGLVDLMVRFHADYRAGKIPKQNLVIVRYDRMMKHFEEVMGEILEATGIEADEELERVIAERAEKQRTYESRHTYDLARFGLDAERIRADCAFIYDTFKIGHPDEPLEA